MKAKGITAFALTVSLFIIGSIVLFGMLNIWKFTALYFIFTSVLFITSISLFRDQFSNKSDFRFMIGVLLVMAIFLTFFSGSVKAYYENSKTVQSAEDNLTDNITYIQQRNKYYSDYIDYMQSQIAQEQSNSKALLEKINTLKAQAEQLRAQSQTLSAPPTQQPPQEVVIYQSPRYEDDERYEREVDDYD